MKFDRLDARILSALQRDGRLSVVELAESIGLSPTPCARNRAAPSKGTRPSSIPLASDSKCSQSSRSN